MNSRRLMTGQKNKFLHFIIATLFIFMVSVTLGLYLWANEQKLAIEGPSYFKITPTGELALRFDNIIFTLDRYKEVVSEIALADLAIEIHGDFAFFSNGDLLVYHKTHSNSFSENLASFFRLKNTSTRPPQEQDGFYRCQIESRQCQKFTDQLPAMNGAFHLAINRVNNEVYIAHSREFTIYRLDESGKILTRSAENLKFPNEIIIEDEQLLVVNTNHHEVQFLDLESLSKIKAYPIKLSASIQWPAQMARTPDNWWLSIKEHDMNHGKVAIYDKDWNFQRELKLEEDSDPGDLIFFNQHVWIVDWSQPSISTFDAVGNEFELTLDPKIAKKIQANTEQIAVYSAIENKSLTGFIIILVLGIAIALLVDKEGRKKLFNPQNNNRYGLKATDSSLNLNRQGLLWLMPQKPKKVWLEQAGLLGFGVLLVGLLLQLPEGNKPGQIAVVIFAVFPILLTSRLLYLLAKTKVGINGNKILIDDGFGQVAEGEAEQITFSNNMLLIKNKAISIGNPLNAKYSHQDIEQHINPRLKGSKYTNEIKMLWLLWKVGHPIAKYNGLLMVIMLLALLLFNLLVKNN